MNTKFKLSTVLLAAAAAIAFMAAPPPAHAGDYAVQKTIWSVTDFTNLTTTATNVAAVVDCTQVSDFLLHVTTGLTNPSAGSLSLQWETSGDGSSWIITNNPALAGSSGWFGIPLTNSGTKTVFTTNITVNSAGYWRATWITNIAGQHMTQVVVRAYIKPKRTNRDY